MLLIFLKLELGGRILAVLIVGSLVMAVHMLSRRLSVFSRLPMLCALLLPPDDLLSPDSFIDIKLDIHEFFPSGTRQLLLDLLAGQASCDYPHTAIRKGDSMPSHPTFSRLLPLAVLLYGRKSLLPCFHSSRTVAYVPFTTGVSQGDGTGSPCASLLAHFAAHQALSAYPNAPVRILAIMDDFHLLGEARFLGPLFRTLSDIFSDCLNVQINLSKSSLNVLQAATIVDPRSALQSIYEAPGCQSLTDLPVVTAGFVCVGTPVGPLSFIDAFMTTCLRDLDLEFQKLLRYPHPQDFLLLIRYCCNQKILHLLRHLGPQILQHSQHFDSLIVKLLNAYFALDLPDHELVDLQHISDTLPSLQLAHFAPLASVQLRGLPCDGGLDLLSMREVALPAFYAAHLRHLRQLLQEGVSGPYLQPFSESSRGASTSLFSDSFWASQGALIQRGAVLALTDSDFHPPMLIPDMILPNGCIFQQSDVSSSAARVSKLLCRVTNQKVLTLWCRTTDSNRQHLVRLRAAYPSLDRRLAHLSPVTLLGDHKPFDLHHKLAIIHQPNAFLKTLLPSIDEGMSQYQLSLYLKLLLGLPVPALSDSSPVCPCGLPHDYFGYHRLNCKRNAGHAHRAAHDLVQLAFKKEFQRVGLSVVDNDGDMRRQYSHLSTKKRGDLAIVSSFAYQFFDAVSLLPRNQAIADVKIVSLVNSLGTWTEAESRHKDKLENPGLVQQEVIKNRKHAPFYSPIGFAFFPLVASCFGSLGPTAVRCLYSLADLELHQHDSFRSRQGLPPLANPSARAQFRALCYRQMSARFWPSCG